MVILDILVFLLVLGLVILVHEGGHFLMAKRAGILCHEFAIGMGPILYKRKKGETLFTIRAIPLGGFVMMAGEEVNDEVLKKGRDIRIVKNAGGRITEIVLDPDDPRYPEAERITVEDFDLKGERHAPLYINEYEVHRKAHYVQKDKKLQIAPHDRSFESKPLGARFLAIFSGPFMNFILAFVLFLVLAFFSGFPATDGQDQIKPVVGSVQEGSPADGEIEPGYYINRITLPDGESVNISTWHGMQETLNDNKGARELEFRLHRTEDDDYAYATVTPNIFINMIGVRSAPDSVDDVVVGPVQSRTPADEAGLQEGDVIEEVDGVTIDNWQTLLDHLEANAEAESLSFVVDRDGERHTLDVEPHHPRVLESQNVPAVQISIGISPETELRFFDSFSRAGANFVGAGTMIFSTINMLAQGYVGVGDLAGPVGIYAITADAVQAGFLTLLSWMAFLSVNIGILNLLPIPALDGGRLVFLAYEGVTRRKPNKTVENTLHFIVFFLLIGLILYVTYNDILHLIN